MVNHRQVAVLSIPDKIFEIIIAINAFNKVDYFILLKKLYYYGISDHFWGFLFLIENSLSNNLS